MVSIVFGLTGKNASGKGTVAKILKHNNFAYHSLSDSLRDELNLLGKEETRENLIEIGVEDYSLEGEETYLYCKFEDLFPVEKFVREKELPVEAAKLILSLIHI